MPRTFILAITVLAAMTATLTACPRAAAAQDNGGDASGDALDGALRDALCAGRDPCHLDVREDAGTDADGRRLLVQKLRLSNRQQTRPLPVRECIPYEWWLVRMKAGTKKADSKEATDRIDSRQLLVDICNEGYGAAGVGADDVTVNPNRFRHVRHGGSAWRWTMRHDLQLAPLRILKSVNYGSWTLGPNRSERHFDWTTFSGRTNWYAPTCNDNGEPPKKRPAPPELPDKSTWRAFEPIPRVDAGEAYLNKKWKKVALGSCALSADSRGNQAPDQFGRGFVVHGDPGPPADAKMRVLAASKKTLIVEVEDDTRVDEAEDWLHTDHVEVWAGDDYSYMNHCLPEHTHPDQWGVLLDGTVKAAYGDPNKKLKAEVVELKKSSERLHARLKIELPAAREAITVVYSDSDDGDDQKRLIATSKLAYGKAPSLGRLKAVGSKLGACKIEDGEYVFEADQSYEEDEPVIGR